MVKEGKGTTIKRLTPEEQFAPIKKEIDAEIAWRHSEIERLQKECNAMPDTPQGHVQKQIGELVIMIRQQENAMFVWADCFGLILMEITDDLHHIEKGTKKQMRKEARRILEELIQSVEKTQSPRLRLYS